ncbi:MAG: Diguanylate cyclase protein [Modestobacter sp.]|nr:Diguanylate cyclase protein [Modestobacter sp.]
MISSRSGATPDAGPELCAIPPALPGDPPTPERAPVPATTTTPRRGVARVWTRLSAEQRIAVLGAGVAAVAITLFFGAVDDLPRVDAPLELPWLVWVAAFAAGESLVVYVQVRRESHGFTLTDLVLAAALCLAEPTALIAAQLTGAALVLLLDRRQSGLKRLFNLAQFAVADCVAVVVFTAVTRGADWSSAWTWIGALLAVAASILTAGLCIFGAIALSEGSASLRELRRMFALSMPFALGTATVGLLVARTAVLDPTGLVLIAPSSGLLIAAYRAYTHARQQEENLRVLHEVTSRLHDSDDAREGLSNFVTAVREAFRASVAELVLLGGDADAASMTRSREGQETVALLPVRETDDLAGLLQSVTGETLTTWTGVAPDGPLGRYIARRGLKDGVMAVLRTDERVHGLLLVAGRLGEVSTFSGSDRTLLETFARHVATSLERGRLQSDLRHVTELKEELRHQAMHDALTGLPNRTLFLDRTQHAVHLAGRNGLWPAVLYIDLDGFKPVNDTYGHEAGDVLLQAFAERLRDCLRAADTAARLGGDEFAVLLHGPIDRDGVQHVLDRIRTQLDLPVDLGAGRVATVGASIGVAFADARIDVDTLIRHADIAMYTAKRGGRGISVLFEEGLGETTPDRPDPAAELAGALDRGEFTVVYQPLVDLRTGRPAGAEALVRWQHPEGVRPPDTFIPLAEESGLITEIGAFVLREACRQAARWVGACGEPPPLFVTVNLSARQVIDPRIVDHVGRALAEAQLDPARLILEITETVLMQDRDTAARNLGGLKALGVRIAIDDFGTGYSSLAYLSRFPLDMLKVAREFVDGLGRDANADVVTRAIVELAGALGLLTVAEGIETTDQRDHVTELGCDLGQGYLFSRPVDAETVLELMAAPGESRRTPAELGSTAV